MRCSVTLYKERFWLYVYSFSNHPPHSTREHSLKGREGSVSYLKERCYVDYSINYAIYKVLNNLHHIVPSSNTPIPLFLKLCPWGQCGWTRTALGSILQIFKQGVLHQGVPETGLFWLPLFFRERGPLLQSPKSPNLNLGLLGQFWTFWEWLKLSTIQSSPNSSKLH